MTRVRNTWKANKIRGWSLLLVVAADELGVSTMGSTKRKIALCIRQRWMGGFHGVIGCNQQTVPSNWWHPEVYKLVGLWALLQMAHVGSHCTSLARVSFLVLPASWFAVLTISDRGKTVWGQNNVNALEWSQQSVDNFVVAHEPWHKIVLNHEMPYSHVSTPMAYVVSITLNHESIAFDFAERDGP